MSTRERAGLVTLIALVVLAPVAAAIGVARSVPAAHASTTTFATLAADSAAGDAAAIAALPDGLRALFAVGSLIGSDSATALPLYECIQLAATEEAGVRRRLQLRLPDSTAAVLYAVADPEDGSLERVEFLRRMPSTGQRGFIWDVRRDRTTSVWWFDSPRGMLRRREERGTVPRGSPVPRAVRGLARQLLVVPCTDAGANSPMNPISGSRD